MHKTVQVMDSLIEVKILDDPYKRSGETVHQYTAWCAACLQVVRNSNGNSLWQTKRSAIRAANEHIEGHAHRKTYIERITQNGRVRVVDSVFGGSR